MGNFNEILRRLRKSNQMTQLELANALQISRSTIGMYEKGSREPDFATLEIIADYFNVDIDYLLGRSTKTTFLPKIKDKSSNITPIQLGDSISIPVFGSVPAGVPIEAIQDISDYIDIPKSWTNGGKEYFALTVKGDSMYPKYLDGDVVVIRVEEDCESGQDCVVYINGYDATLKKVIKRDDYLILQPLNTKYEPRMFDLRDDATPQVKIAGVVVEIRRRV